MKTIIKTIMFGLVLNIVGLAQGGEIVVVDATWRPGGIIACENYIADLGQWAQSWVVNSAPAGARVTGVSYLIVIGFWVSDVWIDPPNFWCSDYEIGISSTTSGGTGNYFPVWDNAGGQKDQNVDDDEENDYDIDLSGTTDVFNGQSVNQTWYFRLKDTVSHAGTNKGVGCFTRLKLVIQYNGTPDSSCCFTLPYEGSVSEAGEAFRVNNTYTGTTRSYGGYFQAAGAEGRGVYGRCTNTVPDVNTYGGFFYAAGPKGRGVFGQSAGGQEGIGVKGWASNAGDVQNFGGHFCATGQQGIGVYGWAENTGNVENYGGYFLAEGNRGIGLFAMGGPYGSAGVFEGDLKISGAGNALVFPDGSRQTTAAKSSTGGTAPAGGFPRPNYDSGWVSIAEAETKTLIHNLGGNTDNYVIDMQFSYLGGGDGTPYYNVIHNRGYGGDLGYYVNKHEVAGVYYTGLTTAIIKVVNGRDPYATGPDIQKIRIRIWVYE
jgi:hypothetical protein